MLEDSTEFLNSDFKIVIQKDGELTNISHNLISKVFKSSKSFRSSNNSKKLFGTIKFGKLKIGYFYAKNSDLCKLVSSESADLAFIGLDKILEQKFCKNIKIVKTFKNLYSWPIVLATPQTYDIHNLNKMKTIATKFPLISKKFLPKIGIKKFKLIVTNSSTEVMPFLNYSGKKIDAIVDLMVTGKTLKDNSLIPFLPPLTYVYPVLITNNSAYQNTSKRKILNLFIN